MKLKSQKQKSERTLLIIDGNNLAHRCRHVFSLSHNGKDVSVTFGVLKVIGSLMDKFNPYSVIVCWDGGIPEFRRKTVPEYKATRRHGADDPLAYEDFLRQMYGLSDYILPMMGMISVTKMGAEADDLMYHASRLSMDNSVIVSNDHDMFQAICDKTRVCNPSKNVVYDCANFQEEFGIPVSSMIDWRALQGDGSDNIPGIPGIGEKTATKLFKEFGTLTGITNAAAGHNPKGKLTGKLAENICSFGFDRLAKNIFIMALYADRVGAKRAVIEAADNWTQANKNRVMKYLMQMAFSSIINSSFIGNVMNLSAPILDYSNIRTPVTIDRRYPV